MRTLLITAGVLLLLVLSYNPLSIAILEAQLSKIERAHSAFAYESAALLEYYAMENADGSVCVSPEAATSGQMQRTIEAGIGSAEAAYEYRQLQRWLRPNSKEFASVSLIFMEYAVFMSDLMFAMTVTSISLEQGERVCSGGLDSLREIEI